MINPMKLVDEQRVAVTICSVCFLLCAAGCVLNVLSFGGDWRKLLGAMFDAGCTVACLLFLLDVIAINRRDRG